MHHCSEAAPTMYDAVKKTCSGQIVEDDWFLTLQNLKFKKLETILWAFSCSLYLTYLYRTGNMDHKIIRAGQNA